MNAENYLVTVERFFLSLKDSGLALFCSLWDAFFNPVNALKIGPNMAYNPPYLQY